MSFRACRSQDEEVILGSDALGESSSADQPEFLRRENVRAEILDRTVVVDKLEAHGGPF